MSRLTLPTASAPESPQRLADTPEFGSPAGCSVHSQSTEEPTVCRICLSEDYSSSDSDNVDEDEGCIPRSQWKAFVSPCPCRGTNKYVHLACLVQHFKAQGQWHNFTCPTCKHPYECKALRTLAELSRDKMTSEYGEGSPQVAHSLCYLAQAHAQLGNARESKAILERGLTISETHFGEGHVVTAAALAELASAHGKLGDVKTQKELLERSLAIKEKHFGAGHINTAITLNNLATAHSELGDVHREKSLLEHSLEIKERHYGKGHVQTTATLVNLAGVYSELGDLPRARKLLEWGLAIEERHFGVGHVETAITLNNLALACGEGGDVQKMRSLLDQSLKIKEQHYGSEHQELCLTLANLGMACGALGETANAHQFCERAVTLCKDSPGGFGSRRHGVVLLRAASVNLALFQLSLPLLELDHVPTKTATSDKDELEPVKKDLLENAANVLEEALGSTAGVRVLALESRRMSNIWEVAGWPTIANRLRKLAGP